MGTLAIGRWCGRRAILGSVGSSMPRNWRSAWVIATRSARALPQLFTERAMRVMSRAVRFSTRSRLSYLYKLYSGAAAPSILGKSCLNWVFLHWVLCPGTCLEWWLYPLYDHRHRGKHRRPVLKIRFRSQADMYICYFGRLLHLSVSNHQVSSVV